MNTVTASHSPHKSLYISLAPITDEHVAVGAAVDPVAVAPITEAADEYSALPGDFLISRVARSLVQVAARLSRVILILIVPGDIVVVPHALFLAAAIAEPAATDAAAWQY